VPTANKNSDLKINLRAPLKTLDFIVFSHLTLFLTIFAVEKVNP
jgi:hypothetical protein